MVPEDTLHRIAQLEDSSALLFQQAEWAAVHIVRLESILTEHQRRLVFFLLRSASCVGWLFGWPELFIGHKFFLSVSPTALAKKKRELARDLERLRLQFLQGLHQLD